MDDSKKDKKRIMVAVPKGRTVKPRTSSPRVPKTPSAPPVPEPPAFREVSDAFRHRNRMARKFYGFDDLTQAHVPYVRERTDEPRGKAARRAAKRARVKALKAKQAEDN